MVTSGPAGTRRLRIALVTEGDPGRMSGGFLYHRRIVDFAADHDADVRFVSVPARRFPLAVVDGPSVLRSAVAGSDVVVVDSLASNTLGPWLALGRARGVPVVGSVHQDVGGIDVGRVRRLVQARSDAMAWRASARLVVASEQLATRLVEDGLCRGRMVVVPPGRDVIAVGGDAPAESVPELRQGCAAGLLCVGNWHARKGIVETVEALAAMPDGLATLHLVGDEDVDASYRSRVLRRLDRKDVRGRVVRHGIVDPTAMRALYDAADVFVLASYVEPYGMVYGEAMAAGTPVVGWRAGNLPNLVDDGVEGKLVPEGDVAALAAALAELASDENLRRRLGDAAERRSRSLPTWERTAARFFAVCRECAGNR